MYVITGATGNIGSKIVRNLLEKGKSVRMVSRSKDKMKPFAEKGAEIQAGSLDDAQFLTNAFKGAEVVFAMEPPDMKAEDARGYTNKIGESIAMAIKNAGVKYVVNLSSVGAHLEDKAGIVQGLADQEKRLNEIDGLNVVHLRAAYFMENVLMASEMIKNQGMVGSPIRPDLKIPMVATKDIADIATEYLLNPTFTGKNVRYILGERDVSYEEFTSILGEELGINNLKYVQFPYEDTKTSLMQMGATESIADAMVELMHGINDGRIYEESTRDSESTTSTSIEEFAKEFAEMYKS